MAEHDVRHSLSGAPTIIGRYRVTGRLGKGAMGVVYSAHDDHLGREVAIKLMMADLQQEPETCARFYREAQITSQLLHRNIITVFDFGQEDGRLYIVMELLTGTTLAEAVAKPEYRHVEDKVDLMLQMCEGLAAAHAKGVVHRDIKPGNLFVQADGTLKILDFGVARIASSTMTASGLILGTPDYMSPEQACARGVDGRSDVFSAAAVFYFMVTGRKPFEAAELPIILQKVLREDPPPLGEQDAPPALARIIMKGLEKDPARRYQNFPDLAADLVRFERQYDAETRQTLTSARERVDLLDRLLAEAEDLRARLELPAANELIAAVYGVRQRYPFLMKDAADAAPAIRVRRAHLGGVLQDLDTVLGPVEKTVERLRTCETAVERAERALVAGDAPAAVSELEEAARAAAGPSGRVEKAQAAAGRRMAELRQRQEQCERLLAECRNAERAGDWARTAQFAAQVLQVDPRSEAALALGAKARAQIDAAAAARATEAADLLERAARAIDTERFDEANDLIDQARRLDAGSQGAARARTRLEDARRAAHARDEEARATLDAIVAARARFATDEEAAIRDLERFGAAHPKAAAVGPELERLRLEAAAGRRRVQAVAMAADADASYARAAYGEALRKAESALQLDAGNSLGLDVKQRARARLAELAEAEARAARARVHVERATQLLAAQNPEKALREIHRALEIDPGRADATAALDEARRQQAAAEAGRRQAEARARAEKARRRVEHGLQLLKAGKLDKAQREFERALEIEPERADAVAGLEDVRRERSSRSAPGTQPPADVVGDAQMRAATKSRPDPRAGPSLSALRRPVVLGGGLALVVLVAALVVVRLATSTRAPGAAVPQSAQPAVDKTAARVPASVPASQAREAAGTGTPAPAGTEQLPTAPENAADVQSRSALPPGPTPTVRRRPGESVSAWYARDRDVGRRYVAAKAALDKRSFAEAAAALATIDQIAPGYRDVGALLQQARDGVHAAAQQALEAGTRAEAAGDWPVALQQYEHAGRTDPSLAEATAEASRRVRDRMKADGLAALRSARQYDALGRNNEAIAAYERALALLPPDDPNVKDARERLAALKKD